MNKTRNNNTGYIKIKQCLFGDKINRQVDTIGNHNFH